MIKGTMLTLADGSDYVVPALSLGAFSRLGDRITALDGKNDADSIATMIDIAHAALKRNYPEMTREEAGEIVSFDNMIAVFNAATSTKSNELPPAPSEEKTS